MIRDYPRTMCCDKTNEIPISTELLKAFDVAGKVVTTDALLTQRNFSKELLEHLMCYLSKKIKSRCMTTFVNSLNPSPRQMPRKLRTDGFRPYTPRQAHTLTRYRCSYSTRVYHQTLTASTLLRLHQMAGLAQVYQYRWQRENNKTGELPISTVWYQKKSHRMPNYDWTENKVHCSVLGEDTSKNRVYPASLNTVSLLRKQKSKIQNLSTRKLIQ